MDQVSGDLFEALGASPHQDRPNADAAITTQEQQAWAGHELYAGHYHRRAHVFCCDSRV
jgi:hypothetical protein